MTIEGSGYNFAKGKGKQPIVISGGGPVKIRPPEKSTVKAPPPSATLTEASRKWHETRGQVK